MGRTKPYIKFDTDTKNDPKVALLIERHGKSWAWDMTMLFCAMGDFYGSIELCEDTQVLHAQTLVGRKGKRFEEFLIELADIGLIDQAAFYEHSRVESKRSLKDGTARKKRMKWAVQASDKAAEKRRAKADNYVP